MAEQPGSASRPRLKWYEYAWAAMPMALIAAGGALGGLGGAAATAINTKLMASRHAAVHRYVGTGLVSLLAAGVYFGLATQVLSLLGLDEASPERVDRELRRSPVYVAIERAVPQVYAEIRRIVIDGRRKRLPRATVEAAVHQRIVGVVARYLPVASDDAVMKITQVMTLELDQIGNKSADACFNFMNAAGGAPAVMLADYVTAEVLKLDADATTGVLESGLAHPRPIPRREEVAPALGRAMQQLAATYSPEEIAALAKPQNLGHAKACALTSAVYKEILSLPPAEAASALRYVYSRSPGA